MHAVAEKKPKSSPGDKPKRGRPLGETQTEVVCGRVHPDVSKALDRISKSHRRTVSAEIGIAAEEVVIKAEEFLRDNDLWTDELERLKNERPVF